MVTTVFEAAKAQYAKLDAISKSASAELKAVPGVGTGPMGLTPDTVKASSQYRHARLMYDLAAANLREFARYYTKRFAAELRAERRR